MAGDNSLLLATMSAIGHRPSAIGHRPSAIGHRLALDSEAGFSMNHDLEEERRPWDASLAESLPGQLVLVGLAYFDADAEEPFEQQQVFGRVVSADERKGILLLLEGQRTGEQFSLPPDTRSFRATEPGEYRLRATGEVVVDPDFTVTFSIRKPGKPNADA